MFVQVIAKTRAVGAVGEVLIVFLFGYGKVKVVLLVGWPSEDTTPPVFTCGKAVRSPYESYGC